MTLSKPMILVTGATGGTGIPVVSELLAKGFPVRALVRRKDARSAVLEKRGVKIFVADLYDRDQLLGALRGVQRAYFLPLMEPYMIQSATAFAVAAREAKIEHVVQMSQWTSHRAHPTAMTQQTWLVDKLFAAIPGVAHTIFNPGMFAHNFLRTMEPAKHAGRSYRPTGPELLTGREMTAVVARAVGHRVMPVHLPIWLYGKVARQQGVDPYQVSCLRYYMEDMKRRTFAFEGGVTNVVEEVTGTPAESFETTARRYAALPFARQTLGNRVKAFLNFNMTPFDPGYNFDKYDKQLRLPVPPHPTLSIDDAQWRKTHAAQMAQKLGLSAPLLNIIPGTRSGAQAIGGVR